MITQSLITPKDIARKFGCSARSIAQTLRDRRIPVVDGVVHPSIIVVYAERLRAITTL